MHQKVLKSKLARLLFPVFVLCVFALSLGQFSVIYKFNEGSVYLFDILIALFDIAGLFYLLTTKKPFKTPLPIIFLAVFCALGAASLAFTPLNLEPAEFATAASYAVRFFSYITFGLIIWNFVDAGVFQVDKIYRVIIYSGFFLFAAGVLQLLVLPDLETLDPLLGWDPHKNRMVSTFFDPNFLGMYFVLCLSLVLSPSSARPRPSCSEWSPASRPFLAVHHGRANKQKRILPIIFLVGIFLTFSRSAWLAAAILIFVVGLKNKALLAVSAAIVLLAIFAVPRVQTRISGLTDPQDSASFRLVSWQNTWEIIKENWVFGVGYNAFRYAQRDFGFLDDASFASRSGAGSDSSLLLVWATSGLFGLIFFVGFFILVFLQSIKRRNLIAAGLIIALIADSVFINSLFYPQIIVAIFAVVTGPEKKAGEAADLL